MQIRSVVERDDTGQDLVEAERDRRLLLTEDRDAQAEVVLAVVAGPSDDVLIDVGIDLRCGTVGTLDRHVDVITVLERPMVIGADSGAIDALRRVFGAGSTKRCTCSRQAEGDDHRCDDR
jgi:hypothetical protein